jgi:hypothetical protein
MSWPAPGYGDAMGDDRLTVSQRVQAVEGIEKYVAELSGMASRLLTTALTPRASWPRTRYGTSARAAWLLERPIGARVPGLRAGAIIEAIDASRRT